MTVSLCAFNARKVQEIHTHKKMQIALTFVCLAMQANQQYEDI